MKIHILRNTATIRYAAEELKKYLKAMSDIDSEISFEDGEIKLGLLSDLGLSEDGVDDVMIDDVIDVAVKDLAGYIAGSNERSVLMGVYNYFKSAGCLWVRPGKDGEYIPKSDLANHTFIYRKKGDYGFRGECIEGAVSYEHLRDTIEWLPKVNMNFFMLEQLVPYNYMSRWYSHEYNTRRGEEHFDYKMACEIVERLESEIKLRGLQLHSLGHGYFYEPYGIHYETSKTVYTISDEAREAMALLNGERGLSHNSPFHTQLCMSNKKVRRDHILWLADYLEKKPYIDFLHVWLGDGANNQCECEECYKKTVSDWYVILLNELDEELARRNIDSKIVFILYNDTMWAPVSERLNNKDRFIATITIQARNHGLTLSPERYDKPLPKFVRNNFDYRKGTSQMLVHKDDWKSVFDGRSFLFEYRMYTDHYSDPGYMQISRTMHEDCIALRDLEFDGIITDKTQRSYFPTALPMAIFGENLFDRSLDYDKYVDLYFKSAFGADWNLAKEYLDAVTKYIDPDIVRVVVDVTYEDTGMGSAVKSGGVSGRVDHIPSLMKIFSVADEFKGVIEKNLEAADPCHRKSWRLIQYHTEYVKLFADILISLANENKEEAGEKRDKMLDFLSVMEEEYSLEFDLHLFARRLNGMLK